MLQPACNITVNARQGDRPIRFSINLYLERFCHQIMHRLLTAGEFYEPEVSSFLVRALRPGDTFIDVGAHVGYFSLLAAVLVGPRGAVYSFEPEPGNFSDLLRNIEENSLSQVRAFNLPVDAEEGDVTFYLNSDTDGGHALWEVGRHPFNAQSRRQQRQVTLPAAALARFAPLRNCHPRLIKIDTEGAEQRVLAGASAWLEKHTVPFVICEINAFGLRQMNSSQMALRSFLAGFGYDMFLLEPDGGLPRLVRPRQVITRNLQEDQEVFNVLFSTPDAVNSVMNRQFSECEHGA